ncbi:MAG TPA: hypothetical protein VGM03_05395 [Phycisphaerae bacterium]
MNPIRFGAILVLLAGIMPAGQLPRIASAQTSPDEPRPALRPAPTTAPAAKVAIAESQPATRKAESVPSAAGIPRSLRPEDLKALAWRSIGPANMGGRVADIAIAPGNAKTFFVALGTGGLFKTTNNGTTFSPVFDKEVTASIGSVVVADAPPDWSGWKDEPKVETPASKPADEKDKGKGKIVWVGTGEGNGRNSSSWGHGVYRSTDGGGSFTYVGLTDSHDIPRLAVDPRNPDVCFVAALGHLWGANKERGVYKTSDGGKNWTPVLQIDENTGACDVLLDPQNPDTVFAAIYMRRRTPYSFRSGGPNGGIYRSSDGGAHWTKLTQGLPEQTGRIGLDIYAKDPRILYAVIESDIGGVGVEPFDDRSKTGGVFRSDDHGQTWTRVFDRAPRGFYFAKVRVDPTDDQRVYLLGYGLSISDDGGRHFRAGGARKPHGDLHAMVINPVDRDHLLLGTDGGAYVSYDRAATWDFLNHLATGEFYNIALDMSEPYRVGGGLQDNGSWIGPSATILDTGSDTPGQPGGGITNQEWRMVNWSDGFHVAFDPEDTNIVVAEGQGGELVRIHLDTGRRKLIRPAPKEGEPRFRFNWNSPFFVSKHQPRTLYFGGNCVFKLTERGDRWERISDDLSSRALEKIMSVGSEAETHGTIVSLAESPLAPGTLWAGSDDGLIHVTHDDGKTWSNVTPPEVNGWYITKIEPSHHERDAAYVSIDGHRNDHMDPHLLVTTDAGQTWRLIAGDLPPGATIKVVREDSTNPDVLYVGTETSVHVTIDRGQHWVRLNGESLPTVSAEDLAIHPRERDLVVGTHGRSIYILDDAAPLSQLTPEIVQSELHLFDVRPAKPRFLLPHEGFWSDRMFRAANPPPGAIITYWLRDYTSDEVNVMIEDARGKPVRKLSGSSRPGLNRVVWDLQFEEYDRFHSPDEQYGQKEFVPAGTYTVTVAFGKQKASKPVVVLEAPGSAAAMPAAGGE